MCSCRQIGICEGKPRSASGLADMGKNLAKIEAKLQIIGLIL